MWNHKSAMLPLQVLEMYFILKLEAKIKFQNGGKRPRRGTIRTSSLWGGGSCIKLFINVLKKVCWMKTSVLGEFFEEQKNPWLISEWAQLAVKTQKD